MAQRVVCLIPARNAGADLPFCLASAALFCDVVVALDDGSTDRTRAILEAHPLVKRVLVNPVRDAYADWDDAENRNRLLDAAAEFEPDWIFSLDADERIDAEDAAALRQFLETDALPGCAYGFQHVAMRGDSEHCLPNVQWIYRLFGYEPGQRFPDRKLHFIPVPTSIPRALWFRTTIRVQHYGSVTSERRMARFEKYAEADPGRRYQADYSHLLYNPAPGELIRWTPRPANLPVLAGETEPAERGPASAIALSAIVIARNDAATIAKTVASVVNQTCPEPFETIVVVSGSPETAAIVRGRFPETRLIEIAEPVLPGAARNAGLRAAAGEFVSFPGSHVELPPGSLAARLDAHRRGYAMVTGITINGTDTKAGWASYFLDHAEGLPGHRASVIEGPPAHCSYARQPLVDLGGFPDDRRTGEDAWVNRRLANEGYVALRDPAIQFTHRSPCRTLPKLITHHFKRGQGWGQLQVEAHRDGGHLLNRTQIKNRLIRHLPNRLARIEEMVRSADPALAPRYETARPLIRAGAISAWLGMWFEILRPARGKTALLFGSPRTTVAIVTPGQTPSVVIVQIDQVDDAARRTSVPLDLRTASVHGQPASLSKALGLKTTLAPLPEIQDVLENALDLAIDGVIVAQPGGAHLSRTSIVATNTPEKQLARVLTRLNRAVVDSPHRSGADEQSLRDGLKWWGSNGPARAPMPEVWMP